MVVVLDVHSREPERLLFAQACYTVSLSPQIILEPLRWGVKLPLPHKYAPISIMDSLHLLFHLPPDRSPKQTNTNMAHERSSDFESEALIAPVTPAAVDPDAVTTSSLQALQSSDQRKVMDIVDKLRRTGLSGIVELPQLVVCGDQSSGKSSVLEAITEIPFPRKENLCTRFATEVSTGTTL